MADTSKSRPLWQVMAKAAPPGAIFGTPGVVERRIAAEIRAIAKWLEDNDAHFNMGGDAAETAALLRGEADRAEAGE